MIEEVRGASCLYVHMLTCHFNGHVFKEDQSRVSVVGAADNSSGWAANLSVARLTALGSVGIPELPALMSFSGSPG